MTAELLGGRSPAARQEPVIKIALRVAHRPTEFAVARSCALHARLREEAWTDAKLLGGGDGVEKSLGRDISAIGVLRR
jgi:hypothetical protein